MEDLLKKCAPHPDRSVDAVSVQVRNQAGPEVFAALAQLDPGGMTALGYSAMVSAYGKAAADITLRGILATMLRAQDHRAELVEKSKALFKSLTGTDFETVANGQASNHTPGVAEPSGKYGRAEKLLIEQEPE